MQKAESAESIDWPAILGHYDQLVKMTASPVVTLNRAVVVVKVHGAEAALAALAPLEDHTAMRDTCWRSWVGSLKRRRHFLLHCNVIARSPRDGFCRGNWRMCVLDGKSIILTNRQRRRPPSPGSLNTCLLRKSKPT
jgi:hypothetical protein